MQGDTDFRIREIVVSGSGILRFGIHNSAQGIRNPANDWHSESKFH